MQFIFWFTVFSIFTDIACTESQKEAQVKNTMKEIKEDSVAVPSAIKDKGSNIKSLWSHNPLSQIRPQPDSSEWSKPVSFRKPHIMTKLSKSLHKGFEHFFPKSDFGFERRNKPITLIAVRKNKLAQKRATNKATPDSRSEEAAELQSPYNAVSSFWQDEFNS